MEQTLNEDWTADVVGRMHKLRISNTQLAAECKYAEDKCYTAAYLSTVLNGRKEFENEENKQKTKDIIFDALDRLEKAIVGGAAGEPDNNDP